jgi:hypothetical protein
MTKANVVVLHRDCRPQDPTWIDALRSRLAAIGAKRQATLAPERWSAHMLRDVGLEGLTEETPREMITSHMGWPAR